MAGKRGKSARGGSAAKTPRLSPGAVQSPALETAAPVSRRDATYTVDEHAPVSYITGVRPENWFSPQQPMRPFGPPLVDYPREWDYPVGENLQIATPRMRLQQQLRLMSRSWGVLRAVIQTRKDQFMRMPWEFQVRDQPRRRDKWTEEMREFFRRPDGKRRYSQWARMILEDLFVIDAPTLYVGHRTMSGRPLAVEVLDGATMKVLIDDFGRIPDFPSPAYQQIVKGLPMVDFDETEILYCPMNLTPEMPIYGYSPVEQIYMEIMEAIQKTMYTLGFWKEGNLPELLVSVPKDWTPSQIAAFQALMDTELAGRVAAKSRMRFVPEGMRPYDIKGASGEGLASQRDENLIRLACYVFSVPPTPFVKANNRATAQAQADAATLEGLWPLMSWFKDCIMDPIVQDQFGYDEVEFAWKPMSDVDQLKRSQVAANYVRSGLRSINELRDMDDLPPVHNGEEILVYTNNGVMTLSDAIAAGKLAAAGGAPSTGGGGDGARVEGGRPSGAASADGAERSDAEKVMVAHPRVLEEEASAEDHAELVEELLTRIEALEQRARRAESEQ